MVTLFCCCNTATVVHIGMRIFNFVVLSVITAPHNVPIPHINKTHLRVISFNVSELELSYAQKTSQGKRNPGGSTTTPVKPYNSLSRAPSLHRGMLFLNAVQSK